MWKRWQAITLWKRILGSLLLGVVLGAAFKAAGLEAFGAALEPVGKLFINAIKMLMVPIVFVTIVAGVTALQQATRLGRMALRTIALYFFTTACAVTIGLVIANLLEPGRGITLPQTDGATAKTLSLKDVIVGLIPPNPVAAMANGEVLPLIVFAILLGLAINAAGRSAQPLKELFDAANAAIMKLVHFVMEAAPFGIFALVLWVIAELSVTELMRLMLVVVTLYLACLLQIGIVYTGLLTVLGRLSPKRFFQGIIDAQAVAFTTSTSAGTLPVTMANVEDNLGVSRKVASFVLPLGATMNMDGTAIYMGIAAVFTAQALGIDLTTGQYATIVLTGTLASIGAASIPSAGLIIMPVVLSSVGLPLGAIALFFPIDRIMDMMRTMTNVTGDATVAVLVADAEGELDRKRFTAAPVE